ncbi:ATPase [Pontibacillus halophilus JSM 076056 = DSM 19796]|uniref:Cd(2+)-exporting ATPase n=1 Tax=Pontibacillus halophilus JSM 076056 = DSM 19796 TaxID=1385510 RepID=A0A0A5GD60_9BACI|nr:heavy metal translocating P-type ATPase [Pontibacillus halophilus]KGX91151.1 ATPase [Pontibacillus halophilus JSM 076056 = DSM 19796]
MGKNLKASCCSSDSVKEKDACCSSNGADVVTSCCSSKEEASSSCCSSAEEEIAAAAESLPYLQYEEYRIEGMDCPSCAKTIEKALSGKPGIQSVQVNYGSGKLVVGSENPSHLPSIEAEVKKLGFKAISTEERGTESYRIQGMDCGSCAKTIEKHLGQQSYVHYVSVNFSTGKMKIAHDSNVKEIKKQVQQSGFEAELEGGKEESSQKQRRDWMMIGSGALLASGFIASLLSLPSLLVTLLYAASIVIGGWKPVRSAYYAVKSRSLDMNVLMSSAAIGAALIGEWFEGAMVVWLFALGNALQNRSMEKTRDSIRGLMDLAPQEAVLKQEGKLVTVPVERVQVGDVMVIKPGEKIPLDGNIAVGYSSINEAPITGESMPVDKTVGDAVYAGTMNEEGSLDVKVTKLVEDTTLQKIIHLVEEAQEQKAPTEAFVDRFARIYTPVVFLLALAVMVLPPLFGLGSFSEWFYSGLTLLVVACPCALVISTPVAIVSAIGNAAKRGVLIKGGTFLEQMGAIDAFAFDKTGTLTEGKPVVTHVESSQDEEELLRIAKTIESYSTHPIANAITTYVDERGLDTLDGEAFKAVPGKGVEATIGGTRYFAGNPKWFKELGVTFDTLSSVIEERSSKGDTLVLVGTETSLLGLFSVADTIRDTTVQSIEEMKLLGDKEIVMLTGDHEGTARLIASQAGIDTYYASLLPEDKVTAIQDLQKSGKRVAMIGDGINDAPALATADIGVAMGGAGSDTAMNTADIVLMADHLDMLPKTVSLSQKALAIIKQNVWFSLLTKLLALLLIFPGLLTLWMAVIADTGAALLVILNSMRLIRRNQ